MVEKLQIEVAEGLEETCVQGGDSVDPVEGHYALCYDLEWYACLLVSRSIVCRLH